MAKVVKTNRKSSPQDFTKKLLPCPFCGASGEDIDFGECNVPRNNIYNGFDYVQCTECGAEIRAYRGDMPPMMEAVEKWNQRAGITPECDT